METEMKQSIADFNKGHALLLTTTGLASAAALAVGVQPAQAEGLYAGISFGAASGEAPYEDYGDAEDYSLAGTTTGIFVGAKFIDFGTFALGGELAISGNADGDPDLNSSYEGAYDINWVGDAKLRLSADVGKLPGQDAGNITVYGFVGASIGDASNYYTTYNFSGTNFGVGVEATLSEKMFVGLEVIQRNVSTYDNEYDTSHQVASLRVGFKF
jgi:hypothetical protein